ncbi:MAG: class I SAM-dependent methyltransferase [Planctomycetota bacterium]
MSGNMREAESGKLRNPKEDGRTCCLCGGNIFRLLHQWEPGHPRNSSTLSLAYWECSCKLAILHPVPEARHLPDQGDWWSGKRKLIRRNPRLKRVRGWLHEAVFGTAVQRLVRTTYRIKPGGRLLDIGCGDGRLLSEASRYYECEGLEPSCVAVERARQRGLNIIESCFEPAEIPSGSYDVVTLDAVLEHVADPVDLLRKVNRILKPRGVVTVKVPKLWGPSHRRHGREWNGYRLGYHLTMFSGRTMDAVLSAAGFSALRRFRRDRVLDDILIVWGRKVHEARERDYGKTAARAAG